MSGGEGRGTEGRRETVQIMPDFVDGEVWRFLESGGCGGEGGFFKEKADFVVAGQEVSITNVGGVRTGTGSKFG